MDAAARRKHILKTITQADAPITAAALSNDMGVSRQVIVGDVALLRAAGHDITATSRGYAILPQADVKNQYLGRIVSHHAPGDTKTELYGIVDLGGTVVNVIIEHDLYGDITGSLNLKTREDVDYFMDRLRTSRDKLLLELTHHGVHQHTIACRDRGHFEEIVQALRSKQLLYEK